MIISNTYFPHKNIHKQTWISPYGLVRNQIDHMLVDNRIKSCVRDIRSMRGSSAMSDHFFVKAKITLRISTKWSKKNKYKEEINKDILKTTTADVYQEKISMELRDIQEMVNLNETWEKVEQAIKITVKEVHGYVPKKTKKIWFNDECKAAQEEKDKVRTKVLQNPSEDNKRLLAQKKGMQKRSSEGIKDYRKKNGYTP